MRFLNRQVTLQVVVTLSQQRYFSWDYKKAVALFKGWKLEAGPQPFSNLS